MTMGWLLKRISTLVEPVGTLSMDQAGFLKTSECTSSLISLVFKLRLLPGIIVAIDDYIPCSEKYFSAPGCN